MKKALAILMILALVVSAATAEITFGAWGRGLFIPVMNSGADDEDNSATTAISWGTPNPRIGMTIKGVSENAGFQIDWNSDGEKFSISDQNKIWVKPVSMVTVSIGRVFDDTLRGNACFGAWDWYRAYSVAGMDGGSEGFVFERIDTKNQGFVVSVAPMDAFYVVASFNDLGKAQKTEYLIGDFQIQAGYTIANIGQIRAGYTAVQQDEVEAKAATKVISSTWTDKNGDGIIDTGTADPDDEEMSYVTDGAKAQDKEVLGTFEVAFKLTAIENLYVDAGIRMTTNKDVQDKYTGVNLYASYKMDAFKFHLISRVKFYDDDGVVNTDGDKIKTTYMAGIGADYALANGFSVMGDFRFMDKNANMVENKAGVDSDKNRSSFFAGVNKDFSNGNIGAGVEVLTGKDTGFAIPIRVGYSF